MSQTKRPLYISENSLSRKKKSSRPINCLENLPNELFYDIFEYLDGCEIYQAFDKLNAHFQSLLTCSSFLLKIQLDFDRHSQLIHYCHHVILPNKDRLLSLHLHNSFLTNYLFIDCRIDVSFNRLESIFLRGITIHQSILILSYLKCLPCLYSLTMKIEDGEDDNLKDVYEMVFHLPSLKYYKLHCLSFDSDPEMDIDMPLVMKERWSTIEYLVIGHDCLTSELLFILSHTPRLRHLTCESLSGSYSDLDRQPALILSHLTYISIAEFDMMLDEFEKFINKLSAPVQILIIKESSDETILNAYQWEQLITNGMPQLHQLDLTYSGDVDDDPEEIFVKKLIAEFRSPFWMFQQSSFDVKIIDDEVFCTIHLSRYTEMSPFNSSINSFKNIWREIYPSTEIAQYFNPNFDDSFTDHSTTEHFPMNQLSICSIPPDKSFHTFADEFKITIQDVQFTHLNINCEDISTGTFVRVLQLLPHLNSLKVSNFPFVRRDQFFDADKQTRFISVKTKISKVNVEKIIHIDQVHFLLHLCPQMQYFQMALSKHLALDKVLRFILTKSMRYTPHVCSLCLTTPYADDKIVHRLQIMIKSEKLLTDYMIKRLANHILLKWK